jgi:hypothetical protein
MRFRIEKPATAICPRTGSRVFIRDELLGLREPIEVVCPVCEHWHIWDPKTLTLSDPDDMPIVSGGQKPQ